MSRQLLTQAQCDELRALCEVHSLAAAARIVGCQRNTVRELRDRGWVVARGAKPLRARPADFAKQARRLTRVELARHYGAGGRTILRWAEEIGLRRRKPDRTCPSLPLPDGSEEATVLYGRLGTRRALARKLERLGPQATADLYGVSVGTLNRWRRRLKLPLSWSRQAGAKRDPAKPIPPIIRPKARRAVSTFCPMIRAADEPARVLTFEEQLARVRAGARLSTRPTFRPADPEVTLGGVASAML